MERYEQKKDRIFVLCGGNSLRGVPLGWLRQEDVISVNYMGREHPWCKYWITADSGCIKNSSESGFWDMASKKIVVVDLDEHPRAGAIAPYISKFDEHVVPTRWDGSICMNGAGFATGKNTGFCALQYAVNLGYKKIYLLGVDLDKTNEKKYCYADGVGTDSPYDLFYEHYKTGLRLLKANFYEVYSCSPASRINLHAPYIEWKKLVPKMPVFVSHYTMNTPYGKIVENLVESLDRWDLDRDVEGVLTLGNWRANSNYCAAQVKKMLDRYEPRSVLRLDADAVVQKYPELFTSKGFRADVAAVIWEQSKLRPDGELMGGTLFFRNNKNARHVVDGWLDMLARRPHARNSDMLHHVIVRNRQIKFGKMPLSYCQIYDYPAMGNLEDGVIVHYQASRTCKKIVNQMGPATGARR